MKDGLPDISPEGLKKLKKCIDAEPSTKSLHTDAQGNYSAARQAVHRKLIDEFKHQRPCVVNGKPIAVLTGGAPGSGKTHFLKGFAPWMNSDKVYHIDADAVRAKLPEYKGWNADNSHEETSDIVKEMLNSIGQPCKHDLVYDGTMNKAKKYLPLVDKLKKLGYEVLVIYMEVPRQVSVSRAMERYQRTGRYVPIEVIDEVYENGLEAYERVIEQADGYIRVDGLTGEILEKGGTPIPTTRDYETIGCDTDPCNGDKPKANPSKLILLAKARARRVRVLALAND
jgi:predicted ABC-type ATPase